MNEQSNALNWFEISVTDMARARRFYENIFDVELTLMELDNFTMAMFPFQDGSGKASGALVKSSMHTPSKEGVIVYLNGNPDLQRVLDKIESAGGKIEIPKTQISEDFGYMAFFLDTEGNKMALHSQD